MGNYFYSSGSPNNGTNNDGANNDGANNDGANNDGANNKLIKSCRFSIQSMESSNNYLIDLRTYSAEMQLYSLVNIPLFDEYREKYKHVGCNLYINNTEIIIDKHCSSCEKMRTVLRPEWETSDIITIVLKYLAKDLRNRS